MRRLLFLADVERYIRERLAFELNGERSRNNFHQLTADGCLLLLMLTSIAASVSNALLIKLLVASPLLTLS